MSVLWTAADAAAATGGRVTGNWSATGVSIDTRELQRGDLFVALRDVRDGHDFVADALARGAAAALVSRVPEDVAADAPLLIVDDVLDALGALGRAARARTQARVIGVTGSVGKTGTKDMLRTALASQGRVHAAVRSFNNHWGVPLTLARMPADTDFAVIEIGMNHPGEIGPLSRLAEPDVAIITTVAAVHMAAFNSVEQIATAKAEIFEGLRDGGTAILNADIDTLPILRSALGTGRARYFGAAAGADARLLATHVNGQGTAVEAEFDGQPVLFKIAAPGRHLAMNALAVLLAVEAIGADIAKAALALAQWQAPSGRGQRFVVELSEAEGDRIELIDESYNANPTSMVAAFGVLAAAEPLNGIGRVTRGRRVALLGDMLELGPEEIALHAGLATSEGTETIDVFHCCGARMKALHEALPPERRGRWFEDAAAMSQAVKRLLDSGDVAMVKGSLGSRVGQVVQAIKDLGRVQDQ